MKKLMKSQDIFGMARVGYIDEYEVYVNTDDAGKIPHFHFRNSKEWSKFHTCICIESPEYFLHGNKQAKLNSKLKIGLENFMKAPVTNSKYSNSIENNWQLVCLLWDLNNSDVQINCDEQPNYTFLK